MTKPKSSVKKNLAVQADPFAPKTSSHSALKAVSLPVSDDVTDEPFFARDSFVEEEADDDDDSKERELRETPEVRARIARAQRLVIGLVSAAALVTVAAFGAKSLQSTPVAQAAQSPKSALVTEAPKPAAEPVNVGPAKAPEPVKEEAKVEPAAAAAPAPAPSAVEAPKAAEPAKVEAVAPAAPSVAAPEPAAPGKTAAEEKKDAQRALDRGKSKDAIAAGERSVALDSADGEAWLILGAAYQEQGKMADARRCYQACLKEGKRGPKGECAAMLH